MANPKHLKVVRKGKDAIEEWRQRHPGQSFDLRNADLSHEILSRANLSGANLIEANLLNARFEGARIGMMMIGACDLAQINGLERTIQDAPSSIGIDTLTMSFRSAGNRLTSELKTFFLNAGVLKELLEELPRILAEVKYCTAFICYGKPDIQFAERLYRDLKARGVPCWLYRMDYTPGERTWGEIGEKRQEAEKVIVICSAPALVRDGVLKEIEEQIDENPEKIIPISLDALWREEGFRVSRGNRDLKPFLMERNYADFLDESAYEASLNRLLEGLKRRDRQT